MEEPWLPTVVAEELYAYRRDRGHVEGEGWSGGPLCASSAAVLARVGFAVEGYARELVWIDGRWRDHVVTARLAPRVPERS